ILEENAQGAAQMKENLAAAALEAQAQAEAAGEAADQLSAVEGTDASYLDGLLQEAVDTGDVEAITAAAWEAVAAAQQNADAVNEAASCLQSASEALWNTSNALSQDQEIFQQASWQAEDLEGITGGITEEITNVISEEITEGITKRITESIAAKEQSL